MMKKILLFVIVISIATVSCRTKLKEVKHSFPFSVQAPEDWIRRDTSFMGYHMMSMLSPKEGVTDFFSENINIIREDTTANNSEEFFNNEMAVIIENAKKFKKGLSGHIRA